MQLVYNKVLKHHVDVNLIDKNTGKPIVNNSENTTSYGQKFAKCLSGNIFKTYDSQAELTKFLLHMPGYKISDESRKKIEDAIKNDYLVSDLQGELTYEKLGQVHVVAKDTEGRELYSYDLKVNNANFKDPYKVIEVPVPGYKLLKAVNDTGLLSTDVQNAEFIFEKVPASKEGQWIKDFNILHPGVMLPDHVGILPTDNWKYGIDFEDFQKENKEYYKDHGYTYLGSSNDFVTGQDKYPLSWMQPMFVPNQGVDVHYYGVNDDKSETKLADDDYLAANPNNPDQTNNGINEDKFYYPEGSFTAKAKNFEKDGWYLYAIRDSKGNVTLVNNGEVSGEYLPFLQDITFLYSKTKPVPPYVPVTPGGDDPEDPGHKDPDKPNKPNKPDNPNKPNNDKPKDPTKPNNNKPEKPTKPDTPSDKTTGKESTVSPNHETHIEVINGKRVVVNKEGKVVRFATKEDVATLPQTGAKNSNVSLAGAAAIALASAIGIFGLGKSKKRD